jgi:hypothetical protein
MACTACALGSFRNTSHALSGSAECVACATGYSTQSTATVHQSDCYLCPEDNYVLSTSNSKACVPCGANAQSSVGTVDGCLCDPGFEPNSTACAACAYGFYKQLAGNHSCSACAAGKQGTAQRVDEATACETCPANTHWTVAGASCSACHANSQTPPGSVVVANCSCDAGYEHAAGPACAACVPGY